MAQSNSKPPLGQNFGVLGSLHSKPPPPPSSSSSSPYGNNNRFPSLNPLPHQSDQSSSFCSSRSPKDASLMEENIDVVSPSRGSFLVLGSSSSFALHDNNNNNKKSKPNFDSKKMNNSSDGGVNGINEDQRKSCEAAGGEVIDDGLFITYMNMDRYNDDEDDVDMSTRDINRRNIGHGDGDGDYARRTTTTTTHQYLRSLSSVDDHHQSPTPNFNAFIIGKSMAPPAPTQSHDHRSDNINNNNNTNGEDPSAPAAAKFMSFGFGNGEFNEYELNKIKNDEKLAEVALLDPKRAKRILANRHSAARSKERKTRYISELEHKVQTLQSKATSLSNQLTIIQKDITDLTNHNNELIFRLQAMEQHARLRDALHEALIEEVKHLKLAAANELGKVGGEESSRAAQHMLLFKHQMIHIDHQQFSVESTSKSTTNSITPTAS